MKRIKLAVLANEFFDGEFGRTGGFGWAARRVAACFREYPESGVDVVYLTGEVRDPAAGDDVRIDGTPLVPKQVRWDRTYRRAVAEKIDLILAIDYRPSYRPLLWMLPRTPVIVWARDPRTPEDVRRIATLRIPGQEDVRPQGVDPIDCTSLATVARLSRLVRRRVLLASKMPHIARKLPSTYGVSSTHVLPNPDVVDYPTVSTAKAERPRVVFLARLDPYKRPWLFVELARQFPDVEFLMLGNAHFRGPGSWTPEALPGNVKLLGHVDGERKLHVLATSWVLVNTSIYEESPVSMLEALACRTPILGCVDTADLAARFGVYAGRFDGSGLDAVPALARGLERLLGDDRARARMGEAGRRWVMREHNSSRFLEAFEALRAEAGANRRAAARPAVRTAATPG